MKSVSRARRGEGWGYPILLALLLAMFMVQPWANHSALGAALVQLIYRAIIIGAVIVVSSRRWIVVSGVGLVIIGFVLDQVMGGSGGMLSVVSGACALAVVLLVIGIFLRDVFHHPFVTVGTISGSICVFVFIGIAWMLMYSVADQVLVDAFHGLSPKGGGQRAGELFYFSFVTLTTLGYGDIAPARSETMSLASLEAVVGQLYLVVMVGAFVGRRGEKVTAPNNREDRSE